ncbi:MAG: hypothetical protein QOC55_2228 [Thermoleophilaceae bacterium]|jgi:hypothetical protein|nr:hypothetical protein [Thermoleophilaceae bacterium]
MDAILSPEPILLPQFTRRRREPTRPPALRDASFEEQFDATTLFFDAFRHEKSNRIVLLGPPLFNLAPAFKAIRVFALPSNTPCPFEVRHLDRHMQIWLDAPAATDALRFQGALGTFDVDVAPPRPSPFRGRRVIFTLSKNNEIEWIRDWIRFNRDVHGADAVLIYDNESTRYSTGELLASIRSVGGIAEAAVVHWPFRYGPQGTLTRGLWDSDFCQLGAWEHARRRFLTDARSVMNSDIDELVLCGNDQSIFEKAERSPFGIARYNGRWVVATEEPGSDVLPRHRDFDVTLRPQMQRTRFLFKRDAVSCFPKWTLVPRRCPDRTQWKVHTIGGWWAARLKTPSVSFRHFREIGGNWKYQRKVRETFDPERHVKDEALARAFDRVDWTR